jgi:F0F1-type ATP synthase gamma subunit
MHPLLKAGENKKLLLLIITSDRGFAAASIRTSARLVSVI